MTANEQMAAALQSVLTLHTQSADGLCGHCLNVSAPEGDTGGDIKWPCPTVTAINEARGADS